MEKQEWKKQELINLANEEIWQYANENEAEQRFGELAPYVMAAKRFGVDAYNGDQPDEADEELLRSCPVASVAEAIDAVDPLEALDEAFLEALGIEA
jgi:hypothetical protein